MGKVNKLLIISMLVMLVCCVSAVSATDIDSVNDVSDDIAIDEVTDVVDDVAIDDTVEEVADEVIDDSADNFIDEGNLRNGPANINNDYNIYNFFDGQGTLLSNTSNVLTFDGDFYKANYTFTNFKINRPVTINADTATFYDMGFEIANADGVILNGGTFVMNAPENQSCYAITVDNAGSTKILNNNIDYTCSYANAANYNYVIKVTNSLKVEIDNNTITANLPLKDIDWDPYPAGFPGISYDKVAGVAVENSSEFRFTNNVLNVTGHLRSGYTPTLDALLVVRCPESYIEGNKIYENDDVTTAEQTNYLYAVDVYESNNMRIRNNVIELNSGSGNLTVNGTGGAYGVQLSGPHTGVIVSGNNITTANNGPNLGIYSQSPANSGSVEITNNRVEVTGRSGDNPWALVSGIEVQDANAEITGNYVTVHDVSNRYVAGKYLFGISYAQNIGGNHTLNIKNNNVEVEYGDYAVYILNGIYCNVCNNNLTAFSYYGNSAVYINGTGNTVSGNQ